MLTVIRLTPGRTFATQNPGRLFTYVILLLGLLFPWNQIGLQFHLYWGDAEVEKIIVYLSVLAVLVPIAFGLTVKLPKKIFTFIVFYVFLTLIFYLLVIAGGEGTWFRYFGVAYMAGALIWIVSDKGKLKQFVIVNFLIGFSMICLNSVTLLHWYDFIELSYQTVPRSGGNLDGSESHLDPLSFGIFGRTENHIHPDNFFSAARLQGWSSEPLHWAYFVYWTLTCSLILLVETKSNKLKIFQAISTLLIIIHLIFLQSTAANIVLLGIVITLLFLSLVRLILFIKTDFQALFLATVVAPGIIIPFWLSLLPDVHELFLFGNVLGEQGNWGGKVSFLELGNNLMARILPNPAAYEPVSHNLILSMYVQGGYLFLILLLSFYFIFLKHTTVDRNILLSGILTITIVTNTLGVETAFFSPFGVMWFSVIYAFVYYRRPRKVNFQKIQAGSPQTGSH